MNKSIYNIALDLHNSIAPHVLPVKQGDSMRELKVTLVEDGSPYEITDDCSAVLYAVLPDGSSASVNMSLDDNVLFADIPAEWTVTVGEAECEIAVVASATNKTVRSPRFSIVISESLAGTLYDVYWDRCPNINSIQLRGDKRKYVADGRFEVTVTTTYTNDTYDWIIIPEEIAPENGLLVFANGLNFTDRGVVTYSAPGGRRDFRVFQSASQVGNGVTVIVRKV